MITSFFCRASIPEPRDFPAALRLDDGALRACCGLPAIVLFTM
ncbi:MAG TPA: hypothetical protein VGM03_05530 [Phycisphaerae bacterium]|jgi:hypothetical protein